MRLLLAAILFFTSMFGASLSAQVTDVPIAPPSPGSMSAEAPPDGIRTATSATVAVRFGTISPADVIVSRLMGAPLYNNHNEHLGKIEDLVLTQGRTLSGVVVSVGGFLGLWKHHVLIDPASLVVDQKNGRFTAFVSSSSDELKNSPVFTYPE